MTIYVFRDGEWVDKETLRYEPTGANRFPTPRISHLEAFESPVTGKTISSWRERERDMQASDSFDTRDLPKDHVWKRGRQAQAKEAKEEFENVWQS